jgi:UDP-glucose 4-epimerase/dTDP-L-rhamnose 4-epimerase
VSDHSHPELHGARVLITGGAGFIGTALARALHAQGALPVLLDDLSAYDPATLTLLGTGRHDPQLTYGCVTDEPLVQHLLREADFVVHAAAFSTVGGCAADPDTAFRSNMAGTDTVLRAVAAADRVRRFVLLSTAQVYGNGDPDLPADQPRIFREDQPVHPLNLYASAKTWAEFHTRQLLAPAGRDFTILRPFSVYGPGQVPKPAAPSWVIAQFCMYGALGQQLLLNNGGGQIRDFLYLDDAVQGIVHSLTAPAAIGRVLNLGTGTATSVRQVAEHVLGHFPGTDLIDAPRPAQDPLGGRADIQAMSAALSWSPTVDVASGIAHYVDWLRTTPQAIPEWLREETSSSRLAAWNPAVPTLRA